MTATPGVQPAGRGAHQFLDSGRSFFQLDPIRALEEELLRGASPALCWPARSVGLRELLTDGRREPAVLDGTPQPPPPGYIDRLRGLVKQAEEEKAARPRSAIRVHGNEDAFIGNARTAIVAPEVYLDPEHPRLVVATEDERQRYEFLLRLDPDEERNEDQLEAALWIAEELMPPSPGWRYSGPGPILLAAEIPLGASWREVFLSPGCIQLPAEELLPAVRAAQVGLHLLRL